MCYRVVRAVLGALFSSLFLNAALYAANVNYEAEDAAAGHPNWCIGYRSVTAWFDETSGPYPGASNGYVHSTITQNASAEISFGGTGIEIAYYRYSNGGSLGYKLDGAGSFTTVSTFNASSQRVVLTIAAQGSLVPTLHKLTLQKLDANGTGIVLDSITVFDDRRVRYEEGALAYFPTSTWNSNPGVWDEYYADSSASNGRLFYTVNSTLPAKVRLNFTGTAVSLIRYLRSDYGSYSWNIDNGLVTGSETMNATQLGSGVDVRVPKLLYSGLPNTIHTLELTCTGGLIVFDAIDAYETPAPKGHYEVESNDPNLTHYSWGTIGQGTWTDEFNPALWTGAGNGTIAYTINNGSGKELIFCGTGVTLNYFKYANGASFTWQLDGGTLNSVNSYNGSYLPASIVCAAAGSLPNTLHRLTIRHSGTTGNALVLDSADVADDNFKRIEQNRFIYTGAGWTKCQLDPDASDRAFTGHSGSTGGDITYKFCGVGVSVSAYQYSPYGSYSWSIDGGLQSGTVNLNAPRAGFDTRIPQILANNLTYGWHTLVLTATGTTYIDAIDVAEGKPTTAWNKYLLVIDSSSISSVQATAVDSFVKRVRELSKNEIGIRSNAALSAADKSNYNLIVVGRSSQNALLNTLIGSTLSSEFGAKPAWVQDQSYLTQTFPNYFAAGKKVIAAGAIGDLGAAYALADLEKHLAGEGVNADLHDVNNSKVYDQNVVDAYTYPAWSTDTQSYYYGGSAYYTATSGALTSLMFSGTEVSLIYRKNSNYGIARYYIDGVLQGTIDMYNSTDVPRATLKLASGLSDGLHTVAIENSGTKNVGSSGFTVVVDGFKTNGSFKQRIEQNSFAFTGSWSTVTDSNASGGTLASTNSAGANCAVTFTGTDVAVIFRSTSSSGTFNWSIDGGTWSGTFNTAAGGTINRRQLLLLNGMSQGVHTLTITRASGTIYIDAIDVKNKPWRVEDPEIERRAEYLNMPSGYRAFSTAPELWSRDEWRDYVDSLVIARKTHFYFYLWYVDLLYRFAPNSIGDPISKQNHIYLREAIDYARSRGLKVVYMLAPTTVPPDIWSDSANIDLSSQGWNPYPNDTRFNPSKSRACSYMSDVYSNEIEWFKKADGLQVWFYDPGGCFCTTCSLTNSEHRPLAWQVEKMDLLGGTRNPNQTIEFNIWPNWAIENSSSWSGHYYVNNLKAYLKTGYGSAIADVVFSNTAANQPNARAYMNGARTDGYRTMGFLFESNIESYYPFLTPFATVGNELYNQLSAMKSDQHTGTYVHRIEATRSPMTHIMSGWEWDLSLNRDELLRNYAYWFTGDTKAEIDLTVSLAGLDQEFYTSGYNGYVVMANAMNDAYAGLSDQAKWKLQLLYDTKNAVYYICANDWTNFQTVTAQSPFFFDYRSRIITLTNFNQYRTWLNSGWTGTQF